MVCLLIFSIPICSQFFIHVDTYERIWGIRDNIALVINLSSSSNFQRGFKWLTFYARCPKWQNRNDLLGLQNPFQHWDVILDWPKHGRPPPNGAGLVQVRALVLSPVSHFDEQLDHEDHFDQPPSTKNSKKISSFIYHYCET